MSDHMDRPRPEGTLSLSRSAPSPKLSILVKLSTKDLNALLKRLECLFTRLASLTTEDKLGVELPGCGSPPNLLDLGVNEGVVVL